MRKLIIATAIGSVVLGAFLIQFGNSSDSSTAVPVKDASLVKLSSEPDAPTVSQGHIDDILEQSSYEESFPSSSSISEEQQSPEDSQVPSRPNAANIEAKVQLALQMKVIEPEHVQEYRAQLESIVETQENIDFEQMTEDMDSADLLSGTNPEEAFNINE